MKVDKFGLGSLIVGIIILVLMLQFVFMQPAGGWNTAGLWHAIVVLLEGAALWLGLGLAIIGILLLLL